MATRRDKETKPSGPINARMAREGGPKDESGTPFRVRDTQKTPGESRGAAKDGLGNAARNVRPHQGGSDEV